MSTETENIGKAHISLAQQLTEQLEQCISHFREGQREKRKRVKCHYKIFEIHVCHIISIVHDQSAPVLPGDLLGQFSRILNVGDSDQKLCPSMLCKTVVN